MEALLLVFAHLANNSFALLLQTGSLSHINALNRDNVIRLLLCHPNQILQTSAFGETLAGLRVYACLLISGLMKVNKQMAARQAYTHKLQLKKSMHRCHNYQ